MEDNDAINIVIINPCKETCRCRSIIFLHPCPQLLPGAGRELGLSWGWVVCLIVNTNPRYTQHVHITGVPSSAFVISKKNCVCFVLNSKDRNELWAMDFLGLAIIHFALSLESPVEWTQHFSSSAA